MYQKIVVPLDKSQECEGVLESIPQILDQTGEAILFHVIAPVRTKAVGDFVILGSQQEEDDRDRAMVYLEQISSQLEGASRACRCAVVVAASVSDAIANFAQQQEADLIAMYTHDRKGLARLMRGSVAREVERKSLVEVRVLGPDALSEGPLVREGAQAVPAGHSTTMNNIDLFKDLTEEQINRVVSLGRELRIGRGEKLGTGGQLGQHLYLILEGEAHLTAHSEVGEIAVRTASAGESFPLAALLGSGTLITSGDAISDMRVLSIPRSPLVDLCTKDAEIGMRVYSTVAQLFANRYSRTLTQLGISAEREMRDHEGYWSV
jgi:CRP-like cAMP-binding protein/nucleotide-binding universal stress UspA family protein